MSDFAEETKRIGDDITDFTRKRLDEYNRYSLISFNPDAENIGDLVGRGGAFDILGEGIGELTGANAAREALEDSRARFRDEQARRQRELEAEREDNRRINLQASLAAGRSRRRGAAATGSGGGSSGVVLGDDRDFLGL